MADHWAELRDEDDVKYFYNSILDRTEWEEPKLPTRIPLDDEGTLLLAEEKEHRVMPSRSDLLSSGRYDLNAAIRTHGGYRAVSCSPNPDLFAPAADSGFYSLQANTHHFHILGGSRPAEFARL